MDNLGLVRRAGLHCIDNLACKEPSVMLSELDHFRRAGGRSVVDLTVAGLGRDVGLLKRLSKRSGVNIIAPTGYYIEKAHPSYVKKRTVEQLAEEMVSEITAGIGETGIRAGVIGEIGVSPGKIMDNERKVLKAAAMAQSETKVPLTVHTWGDPPGKWPGFEILKLLEGSNANVGKVYFSHMDWILRQTNDWSLVLEMASQGVFIAFDNFGNEWPASTQYQSTDATENVILGAPTDFERLQGIKELVAAGFEDRLLLSQDNCQKIHLKKYGGHGLDHIQTNVANLFVKLGIGLTLFDKFTRKNPLRLFN